MKFSIIIPAYNAANRIRNALDSIASQTFTDYELLVVCDSCKDDTAEIAREYTDKVLLVNNNHDGLTRNVGLDYASGDWVMFMDDDDWWMHEFVLETIAPHLTDNIDVLRFGFFWLNGSGDTKPGPWIAVWNKCWRRSFIGYTRFSDRPKWSDIDFNNEMMAKAPRIADLDKILYYYNFMREGSISWNHAHNI